jgi:hypothetical protein
MGTRHRYGRSALFLVRVYADQTAENASHDRTDRVECRGRVQRVADGETRLFNSWRDLVETLREMLSNDEGR